MLLELPAWELKYRVEDLLARYTHCIDSDQLESWPALFTDACRYQVIAKENADRKLPISAFYCDSRAMLVDRVVSLRHANIFERHGYRHLVSSLLIHAVTATEVTASSHYAVFRTRTNGATEIYQTGIYQDRITLENGAWLFREKIAIFDTNRIDSLLAIPI